MNKLVLYFFLFGTVLRASEPDTMIILESFNARGSQVNKEVIFIKDGALIVNNEKLSPTEVITQSSHVKNISTFLSSDMITYCESGTFKHIYKKGKILKVEHGCLNNQRYNDLIKSFKALKKDSITK